MRIGLAAVALLLSGCHPAPRLATPDAPVRCYALEVGEWSRAWWPAAWSPPGVVRLDTAIAPGAGESERRSFALHPRAPLPNGRGGGTMWWHPLGGDSIRLFWAGDYTALDLRAVERGGELSGRVRGSTDVVAPDSMLPVAAVRGRRLECPAAAPPPA